MSRSGFPETFGEVLSGVQQRDPVSVVRRPFDGGIHEGLVRRVRDTSDRRVMLVELTEAAPPIINAYLADVTALHAHEFAALDEQERETFVQLLTKVAASIESLDVDAIVAKRQNRRRLSASRRRT